MTTNGRTYLIVHPQAVVAMDLAMAIRDFEPAASVVVGTGEAEALERLGTPERIAVAFVDREPRAYANSELARLVRERGGRAVLLGDDAERGPDLGFPVLTRPFTAEQVAEVLAAIG
ncbi:hypothetical protein [Rubellimicrobium aerolatum]|uniref:Response regulatory domain-containing protein n=1 Tax=Rubellimicrobium aerolatum TaxID=490979 RepID=A0ABW0SGY5_9RHOB|nr:hypothetical protein [Rubellimicrobium aerolatum]MBP1806427.1 hypothetical protein [Rubellimicrobium aerolatum]